MSLTLKKGKIVKHMISNSEANVSRRMTTSYLGYTFMSHRNNLSSTNFNIDFQKPKNYLFDLSQTFEINAELLSEALKNLKDKKKSDELILLFNNIRNKYHNKKALRKKVNERKSKLLIEMQIFSEFKRKKEENAEFYKEQIKENEENYYSKEEYIRVFQKKLKEVEIYIRKQTRDLLDERYVKYQNWKLKEFLEESDLLNKKREELKKDISNIYKNINDVKKENKLFREEFYLTENDKKKINQEEEKRIKLYIKKYKNQIRVITMRIKLLKHCFNNLNKTLKYLNLNKKNISNNEKNNDEDSFFKEVDTSQLPIDLSRKINNYMDFSAILNKKINNNDESKISELGKTGNFGQANISNINMWDISVIDNN